MDPKREQRSNNRIDENETGFNPGQELLNK